MAGPAASNMSVDGRAMDVRRGDPGDGADGSGLAVGRSKKSGVLAKKSGKHHLRCLEMEFFNVFLWMEME